MKNRRKSRETVFMLLFEWSFNQERLVEELLENAKDARDIELDEFANSLLITTIDNISTIDETIETYSDKWKINRISKVSLASLRLAICELIYFKDIPEGATINEAVELTKIYGDQDESAYVNGILGGLSRKEKTTANESTIL